MTLIDDVIKAIKILQSNMVMGVVSPKQIAEYLGEKSAETIRVYLQRLKKDKTVESPLRGYWRLHPDYVVPTCPSCHSMEISATNRGVDVIIICQDCKGIYQATKPEVKPKGEKNLG